jgi:O-antigen/teichoic acid export membrane protein
VESIFKPAIVLMSGRAFGFVATFMVPMVLVRVFDQGEFGTYKQLFLIYSTLYCVAQLGMSEGLFYFLPGAPENGGRYARNAMLVLGAAGAVCLALLWLTQGVIAGWFNNDQLVGRMPLIGAYLLTMLVSAVLEIVMTSQKRHGMASITYAGSDLLRSLLLITPVLWFGQSGGLDWLLWGAIVFGMLRLAVTLHYLRFEYGANLRMDGALARTQLAYAAPFSIYVLIEVMQINMHMYVVSFHFDAATFAIYAVGCLSLPLVDFLMSSTCNVMMVRMREYLLKGAASQVLVIWRDTTRKLLLLYAPLVGCLLTVAHEAIVLLYTDSYAASVPVFMVWITAVLFIGLLTDGVLRVYAQIKFLTFLGLAKLILIATTIPWYLQTFGLLGAVLATLQTTALTKALALARIKSVLRCNMAQLLPWGSMGGILLAAAAAMLPAMLLKSVLELPPLPLLLVTGAVYAACYCGLVWMCGLLSDAEKSALTGWISGRAGRLSGFFGRRMHAPRPPDVAAASSGSGEIKQTEGV